MGVKETASSQVSDAGLKMAHTKGDIFSSPKETTNP
jgi:hypothetical protein